MIFSFFRRKPAARPAKMHHDPLPRAREVRELVSTLPPLTGEDYAPKPSVVDLLKLERELAKRVDRVADLKAQFRALTYGEFIEAASGMGIDANDHAALKKLLAFANGAEVVPMRMAA